MRMGCRGHWLDGKYAVQWRALHQADRLDCRIDQRPVDAARFSRQHEGTREWSPFDYQLNFNIVKDDWRMGVGMGEGVSIAADGTMTCSPLVDRLTYLVDELGVSEELARQIPADIPTPAPPGSRSEAPVVGDAST